MSATTAKLNYANVPPRATSSRSIRNEVVPSNGSTFNCGNTIIFDLPSNVPNTFFDTNSSYVSMLVTNSDGKWVPVCHSQNYHRTRWSDHNEFRSLWRTLFGYDGS